MFYQRPKEHEVQKFYGGVIETESHKPKAESRKLKAESHKAEVESETEQDHD